MKNTSPGEKFTHEELVQGIHNGVRAGAISPVFCGSSSDLSGVNMLLDGMVELFPSPVELEEQGILNEQGEPVAVPCDRSRSPGGVCL